MLFPKKTCRAAELAAVLLIALSMVSCGGGGEATVEATSATVAQVAALKAKTPAPAAAALVAQPLSALTASGSALAMGALADGGSTAIWCSVCNPVTSVTAQRFDRNGTAVGAPVALALPSVAGASVSYAGAGVLPDGSLLLAYSVEQIDLAANLVRDALYTQHYDASGAPAGAPVQVMVDFHSYFSSPTVIRYEQASFVSWSDGAYAVKWVRSSVMTRSSFPVYETFVQRYDPFGTAVGALRSVAWYSMGFGTQVSEVTALEDGGFLVGLVKWNPPAPNAVRFVPYDSAERTVAIPPASASGLPQSSSVVPLVPGGYLEMSADTSGPSAQILDNDGVVLAQPTVHGGTPFPLADGGFAVAWVDPAPPAGAPPVLVQRYDPLGVAVGDATRAGPAAPPQQVTVAGIALRDIGLALTFRVAGSQLFTQLLREPDPTKQQQVRACHATAKDLTGKEHRQFMIRCLRGGAPS